MTFCDKDQLGSELSVFYVADPGFDSRFYRGDFSVSSHNSDSKNLALQWLHYQVPGVIGSASGLVGRASVYRDWD